MSPRPTKEGRRSASPEPPPADEALPAPPATAAPAAPTALAGYEDPEEVGWAVAVLGGSVRKGSWDPPEHLRVVSFMGGVELDFREARLLDETVVECFTLMGGVNIVVPPDVHVRCNGLGLLGGFDSTSNDAPDPEAPVITIQGVAIMGGVEVKVKKLPVKTRLFGR